MAQQDTVDLRKDFQHIEQRIAEQDKKIDVDINNAFENDKPDDVIASKERMDWLAEEVKDLRQQLSAVQARLADTASEFLLLPLQN